MSALRYVIIGGGAAGVAAATKLRMMSPVCHITCITKEQDFPYNRCALADYLSGLKTETQVMLKTSEQWEKLQITMMRNTIVQRIDADKKQVITSTGQCVDYDKVLIATGRSAIRSDIPGLNVCGVFDFFSLADIRAIKNFIQTNKPKSVIIVGGGFLGLECADALKSLGLAVTVVERKENILPWQTSEQALIFLTNLIKRNGISIRVGHGVKNILQENKYVKAVQLDDGTITPADMVIIACGSKVNNEIALASGLEIKDRCIVVDQHMHTSSPNIFAAGDVCLVKDIATQHMRPSFLWADAVKQGLVAASNMAGSAADYEGSVFITNVRMCNTSIMIGGLEMGAGRYKQITQTGCDFHHTYFVDGADALKGFVLIGNVESVSYLREYMINGNPFKINFEN